MPGEQATVATTASDEAGKRNAETNHHIGYTNSNNNKYGYNHHDKTTTKDNDNDNNNNNPVEYVNVLIDRAGVSGLQCARRLLFDWHGNNKATPKRLGKTTETEPTTTTVPVG